MTARGGGGGKTRSITRVWRTHHETPAPVGRRHGAGHRPPRHRRRPARHRPVHPRAGHRDGYGCAHRDRHAHGCAHRHGCADDCRHGHARRHGYRSPCGYGHAHHHAYGIACRHGHADDYEHADAVHLRNAWFHARDPREVGGGLRQAPRSQVQAVQAGHAQLGGGHDGGLHEHERGWRRHLGLGWRRPRDRRQRKQACDRSGTGALRLPEGAGGAGAPRRARRPRPRRAHDPGDRCDVNYRCDGGDVQHRCDR